jgi:hypothetical protein
VVLPTGCQILYWRSCESAWMLVQMYRS